MGYVGEELSPMQLENQVVVFPEKLDNFVINFSYWHIGEVKVGRKFSCRQRWIVSVFKVVMKVFESIKDL